MENHGFNQGGEVSSAFVDNYKAAKDTVLYIMQGRMHCRI